MLRNLRIRLERRRQTEAAEGVEVEEGGEAEVDFEVDVAVEEEAFKWGIAIDLNCNGRICSKLNEREGSKYHYYADLEAHTTWRYG